ncbi:ABC transporter ATP-binding protein [Ketogulonicigenium vulgare]|uniref:ABC-type nitrate/sulfonate/bicarbonate transport system, ATPase component n=1 Tax=Ketogulonicigenium vulgare (strain WSH-001) TaxID=759362 RepID=F9Y6E9_KETVW|nr:ABC transporter ATP-binding protein [Ketogulonicigenium vulgare]ADO42700.1 ABC transporter ATP-binding protein [Ketogulonicigenium vulgare Y25]AEM40895.1 ABC-type nitrate/sulfonate/bicarbonate transport system, ATPase component [Ketogulonicigenium vulgare WSH-001]ALJ81048.1 ABC transporter [Ketogulonicigenium vulgare]ANW33802.1 ABC transporter [Ketogulonicigenium vulgare]AOZ54611.1 ABC transporter ATP-binding protein [Ketogulonicigenium vulgare]
MERHEDISPAPAAGLSAGNLIELSHVGMTFETLKGGPVVALQDFSLGIKKGEIISLVGPSGCGKSTILRMLAGLQKPTTGSITFGEAHAKKGFAGIAIVFQRPTLLPWLTIMGNVLYPVRVLNNRVTPADKARAQELLEMVGLADMAERMPNELSGGMQQRASIARSLILDPKLLLMDEPFGALDALTREDLQLDLLKIHAQTQKTILVVTHSINEAVLLSDRVAVMSARPGRMKDLLSIDIEKPRTHETPTHARFGEYALRIREGIYGDRAKGDSK